MNEPNPKGDNTMTENDTCPYVPDEPGTVDLIVRLAQIIAGDWLPGLKEALEEDRNNSLRPVPPTTT